MKKLSIFMLFIIGLYGVSSAIPKAVFADNGYGNNGSGSQYSGWGSDNNNNGWNGYGNGGNDNSNGIDLTIRNVNFIYHKKSADITWNTNEPTSGETVMYGTGLSLSSMTDSASESWGSPSLSHEVTLSDLAPNTTYFFVIKAKDESNTLQTHKFSFTTK